MQNTVRQTLRAIVLVAVTASVASAQPWAGSFTKAGSPANASYAGYGVGPYKGTLTAPGAPANVLADITLANPGFSFWCVDGQGILGNDTSVQVFTLASITDGTLQTKLAKAAYVTTIFNTTPPVGGPATSNFNAAIWSIMGTTTPFAITAANGLIVDDYIAQANAGYSSIDLSSFYYVQFDNSTQFLPGGAQELLFQGGGQPFIVPEPASFALMAGGLLMFAGVRRRRVQG